MSIEIIPEPTIRLTREQHERLTHEYQEAMRYWSGPPMSFETWLRRKKKLGTTI